jgi:hypothetical protein
MAAAQIAGGRNITANRTAALFPRGFISGIGSITSSLVMLDAIYTGHIAGVLTGMIDGREEGHISDTVGGVIPEDVTE